MRRKEKIALINKYLDGSLSKEEKEKLQSKLSKGIINIVELQEYENIVRLTQQLEVPEFKRNLEYIHNQKTGSDKRTLLPAFRHLGKVAAVLLFGIVAGAVIMYMFFNKEDQFVEVETKKGDKIHVTLPGNNEVWLNSRSSIKYAASFSGINRVIELKGEGYFRLGQDQDIPVIIKCGQTRIVCTNGSLNIENDINKNKLDIEVEKGWITISHPLLGSNPFVIEEGFKGTLEEMLPLWIEQNKDPNYLAWHTNILKFKNSTLLDVAATLSEVYDVNVDIKGDVKYCLFNETFINMSLETILNVIKKTLNTQIRKNNNTIIITGNPC